MVKRHTLIYCCNYRVLGVDISVDWYGVKHMQSSRDFHQNFIFKWFQIEFAVFFFLVFVALLRFTINRYFQFVQFRHRRQNELHSNLFRRTRGKTVIDRTLKSNDVYAICIIRAIKKQMKNRKLIESTWMRFIRVMLRECCHICILSMVTLARFSSLNRDMHIIAFRTSFRLLLFRQ